MLNIAIICGGPSLERGISLNSARSLLDHLPNDQIAVHPLYIDQKKNFYSIPPSQLYSNTPADFDFKLHSMAEKLDENELKKFFIKVDIAFPVVHGTFGEDGELQEILEQLNVPYIGSNSASCKKIFKKHHALHALQEINALTLPTLVLHDDQLNIPEKN